MEPIETIAWHEIIDCRRRPRGLARNRRAGTPRLPAAARPEHRPISTEEPCGFGEGTPPAATRRDRSFHPQLGQENSPFPTQQGTWLAKDVWMMGIGLGLVIDDITDRLGAKN